MEIDKLKEIWNKNVKDSVSKENFSSEELDLLLNKHPEDNQVLIRRRIKAVFAVLLIFMIVPIINLSKFVSGTAELPVWYIITNSIVFSIYIGLLFYLTSSHKNIKLDLGLAGIKESLQETIKIIKSYKKLVTVGLSLLVLGFTITLSSEIYYGFSNGALNNSHEQTNSFLSKSSVFIPLSLAAAVLLIITVYSIFIRLFNKKFGEQIDTLESNLKELETS